MQAYRHGENLLVKIDKIPEGSVQLQEKVFARGSHGHNHSITGGTLYKNDREQYLDAKNTSLLHPEHSPKIGDAQIEDGFYHIIKQTEYTPQGLIPVRD